MTVLLVPTVTTCTNRWRDVSNLDRLLFNFVGWSPVWFIASSLTVDVFIDVCGSGLVIILFVEIVN